MIQRFLTQMKSIPYLQNERQQSSHSEFIANTFKNECNEDFGTLLVHRDITKEYEVAQMKSEFVSTVSHELTNTFSKRSWLHRIVINERIKTRAKSKVFTDDL